MQEKCVVGRSRSGARKGHGGIQRCAVEGTYPVGVKILPPIGPRG